MKRYNPAVIEPKWQKIWSDSQIYAAKDFDDKPKYTVLTEFPYPSGSGLHMGHMREYTLGDIMARHKRVQGFNVLFPMGFDAFGLPAENFAIKNKITPQSAVEQNVAHFREQMEQCGYSFDWNRSFSTTDPEYYRWTQWFFLQFFKSGLAYQDEIDINWCPFCKTGIANEEAINGRHERCDTLLEKRSMKQWMLRITDYAERLINGLADVDYPPHIADQQINWIGRKEGIDITYKVVDSDETITTFTTRPDTNFGATFISLAPEHTFSQKIASGDIKSEHQTTVANYIQKTASKTEIERQEEGRKKTGVFTGYYVKNDLNGRKLPIYISDFVLATFGTGAVVGVPGHDLRDFEFAVEFDLPIVRVVVGQDGDTSEITEANQVQEESGTMINSDFLDGMDIHIATEKIMDYMEEKNIGKRKVSYRLRDWVYSRQRYWGEPIPIIHCDKCGAVAVPDDQLPVELPAVDRYEPSDDGRSPLSRIESWVNITCPKCGAPAKRETDTMPNWAASNWYYLRYYDAHNNQVFADPKKLKYWDMVDIYLGGMEHTTLHLLYSRFHHQFMYDQGLVPTPEPYAARRGQGIILAADGRKMSKSLGNVVDPAKIIESGYGADAVRLSLAFIAPYDQTTPWGPEIMAGTYRFLGRVWKLAQSVIENSPSTSVTELLQAQHKAIKKVTEDLEKLNFNTAIAVLMEYLNSLIKESGKVSRENLEILLRLLAPFAPHIASELYEQLGNKEPIEAAGWPKVDEKYLITDKMTIAVQVNGKLRGEVIISRDTAQSDIEQAALTLENVAKFIGNKKPARIIYVPEKIVNIVVKF